MKLYGDNKTAIHIVKNVVFHERIKHIEVAYHIVRRKLEKRSLWRSMYHYDSEQIFLSNHLVE